jgi:hypothetical protein
VGTSGVDLRFFAGSSVLHLLAGVAPFFGAVTAFVALDHTAAALNLTRAIAHGLITILYARDVFIALFIRCVLELRIETSSSQMLRQLQYLRLRVREVYKIRDRRN